MLRIILIIDSIMNRVGYNGRTVIDETYDDVYESSEDEVARFRSDTHLGTNIRRSGVESREEDDNSREKLHPSPTGYRDYTPPAELLLNRCHTSNSASSDRHNDDNGHTDSAYSSGTDPRKKDEAFTHKTILLGDSGVGKTSLLVQFDTGQFQTGNFAATVGIGFTNKIVTVDNTRVKLQIWDTAGQERFRSITHAYYRDAHALLLLYDVTNKTSYDNIRAWLCEIREYAHDDVVVMLLGNKCDCGNERTVRKGDGERLAREHNVPFMETSAKTGLNVELAFFAVARHLKARKSEDPDKTKFNVQDYVRQQTQQTNNCFTSNCSTT